MAKEEDLLAALSKTYKAERAGDAEKLHNAIVEIIQEHKTAVYDTLFVLDLIRWELMSAQYKQVMGVVKLTDDLPIRKVKEKEK